MSRQGSPRTETRKRHPDRFESPQRGKQTSSTIAQRAARSSPRACSTSARLQRQRCRSSNSFSQAPDSQRRSRSYATSRRAVVAAAALLKQSPRFGATRKRLRAATPTGIASASRQRPRPPRRSGGGARGLSTRGPEGLVPRFRAIVTELARTQRPPPRHRSRSRGMDRVCPASHADTDPQTGEEAWVSACGESRSERTPRFSRFPRGLKSRFCSRAPPVAARLSARKRRVRARRLPNRAPRRTSSTSRARSGGGDSGLHAERFARSSLRAPRRRGRARNEGGAGRTTPSRSPAVAQFFVRVHARRSNRQVAERSRRFARRRRAICRRAKPAHRRSRARRDPSPSLIATAPSSVEPVDEDAQTAKEHALALLE